MNLRQLLGIDLPIIQAPMAGAQGSAMAIAVSNTGGLGSLPCSMLSLEAMRNELATIKAQTDRPFNVNFFCHTQPTPSLEREAAWKALLSPYYKKYGIDPESVPAGTGRASFGSNAADVLEEFKPAVVSFHFGLPSAELLARVKSWGSKIFSSATTVDEALWLGSWRRRSYRSRSGGGRTSWHLPVGRPHYSSRLICPSAANCAKNEAPDHRRRRHR